MDSDLEAVKRVVEAFERSDWREIDVRSGGLRVHLVADGEPTERSSVDPPEPPTDEPAEDERPAAPPPAASPTVAPSIPPGARTVAAPSPGIFWRAPEPGAPPFAEVGDEVDAATTLCIIEVMKLMNHLKAGHVGRVVAILAENGAPVDKDQPLFALAEPTG